MRLATPGAVRRVPPHPVAAPRPSTVPHPATTPATTGMQTGGGRR